MGTHTHTHTHTLTRSHTHTYTNNTTIRPSAHPSTTAAAATTTAATTACAVVGSRCVVLIENVGFPSFDGGHIAHAEVHTNEVLMKGHAHNSSSEFNGLLVALRACPNPLFVLPY